MLRFRNLTRLRRIRVISALRLLRLAAWRYFEHFLIEIDEVAYRPGACGPGAVACTGIHLGRRAVLSMDPLSMDLIELAVTLSHESRHHYTTERGRHLIRLLTCRDCSDPAERNTDPIYRSDEALRRRLRRAMRRRA